MDFKNYLEDEILYQQQECDELLKEEEEAFDKRFKKAKKDKKSFVGWIVAVGLAVCTAAMACIPVIASAGLSYGLKLGLCFGTSFGTIFLGGGLGVLAGRINNSREDIKKMEFRKSERLLNKESRVEKLKSLINEFNKQQTVEQKNEQIKQQTVEQTSEQIKQQTVEQKNEQNMPTNEETKQETQNNGYFQYNRVTKSNDQGQER